MEHNVKRYTKFGRKPRTAVAALKQARDFLVEEGKQHWTKGTIWKTDNKVPTEVVQDTPFCGHWGVCAIGAVAAVTGTLGYEAPVNWLDITDEPVTDPGYWDTYSSYSSSPQAAEVYDEAVTYLDLAAQRYGGMVESPYGYISNKYPTIVDYNDNSQIERKDVIKRFNEAIAIAEEDANINRAYNSWQTRKGLGKRKWGVIA